MFHLMSWVLGNFGLFMLALAALIITLQLSTPHRMQTAEIFYRWIALLPLGCTGIYACTIHAFYRNVSALTIGCNMSPFQYHAAVANFSIGILGILSFRASYSFRLATVIASTLWLWGDASVHIAGIIANNNFQNGNAGSWLWIDIIVPVILITCITLLKPRTAKR